MFRRLKVRHESLPLATPFRISRGVKYAAEVVVVEVSDGTTTGYGEAVPYGRYDETVDSVIAQLGELESAVAEGLTPEALQGLLPPGAARNALDCALWDLRARMDWQPVAAKLGQTPPPPLPSALTVSLDTPEAMAEAAKAMRGSPLVKIKVDANDPEAQMRAVCAEVPGSRIIVDPNESWDIDLLRELQPLLEELDVDLVEQPLPAQEDEALQGFRPVRPICADESCHVAADLPRLARRYQSVNIKLDKTGGLTEALRLLYEARALGFQVMTGCMISSSLSIAPAFHIARHAAFVDLDGPLWLKQDRPGGVRMHEGLLVPPEGRLWGG